MMTNRNLFQLGIFTDYELWKDGIELIERTVNLIPTSKHFNSFFMNYYENLNLNYKILVKSEEFYSQKVENSLFYNYDKDFFCIKYPKSKSIFRVRDCRFLSYPMLNIHNMIGIYLLKLTYDFINESIKKSSNIFSFYGGEFKIQENKLYYDDGDLYYYNFYKKFKKKLYNEAKGDNLENKIVLRIDIENYYDSISIKKLLENIEETVRPSKLTEHKYNETVKETIVTFFEYLMEGKNGLPAIEHFAINGFIGYLYLCFAEFYIIGKLKKEYKDNVKNLKIIRYIDDIFLVIEYQDELEENIKVNILINLLEEVSEILYNKYELKVNKKTKWFDFSSHEMIEEFRKEIKYTSQVGENYLEDEVPIPQKYEIIKKMANEIKQSILNPTLFIETTQKCDIHIFNEVYKKNIGNYLKKIDSQKDLKRLFNDIDLNFFKVNPKPLIALVYKEEDSGNRDRLKEKILKLNNIKINEVEIIFEILSQENFENISNFLDKISQSIYFKKLVIIYNKASEKNKIEEKYTENIHYQKYTLISQIIRRKIAFQKKNYALALNHLVNEFQLICYYIDDIAMNYSKYTLENISAFLENKTSIDSTKILKVRNIFDERHTNQISHSISEERLLKSISEQDYLKYEEYLVDIIKEIIKNLTN